MKPKKFNKLSIKKTTIANLGADQLRRAKGGEYTAPGSTCKTCYPTACGPTCDATCTFPPELSNYPCVTEDPINCQTEGGIKTCNPAVLTC